MIQSSEARSSVFENAAVGSGGDTTTREDEVKQADDACCMFVPLVFRFWLGVICSLVMQLRGFETVCRRKATIEAT